MHKLAMAKILTVALKKNAIPEADIATKNKVSTYRKNFSTVTCNPEKQQINLLRKVACFLQVLRFRPPIKLTATI